MKLKPKHWRVAAHYARWVDERWFPDFKLTRQIVDSFIKYESNGRKAISDHERDSISPLVGEEFSKSGAITLTGKASFELQKKMFLEEVFSWWAEGFGWFPPIAAEIQFEFNQRNKIKNTTWLKELVVIFKALKKDPIEYLCSLSGSVFSAEDINRILNLKLLALNK